MSRAYKTAWIGTIFESIRKTGRTPGRVRAVDMRNLLLLLPFLLHNLLEEEVAEYNSTNFFDPIVDPSNECIGIVLLFIDWYMLYRRRYPPKVEVDNQDLQSLSFRYLLIKHILLMQLRLLRILRFKSKRIFQVFGSMHYCISVQEQAGLLLHGN